MLDAAPAVLDPDALLVDAERLVALADEVLVGLVLAGSVGRDDEARPEGVGLGEVGQLLRCHVEDRVEPVEVGLQVQVVPEAVAKDERNGLGRLARAERLAEAGELLLGNGEADNDFDCGSVLGWKVKEGKQRGVLLTSTMWPRLGQASESGSWSRTSAVLKIPWMEQALTLNW